MRPRADAQVAETPYRKAVTTSRDAREKADDLCWGPVSFPPSAQSTGPLSKGDLRTAGLSRGRLRGQSAHML